MVSPWWYKVLAGQIVAAVVLGLGMTFPNFPFGTMAIGLALVVAALVLIPLTFIRLKRATGASTERYTGLWSVMASGVVGILALGVVGQYLLNWSWAMLIAAVLGLVTTVWFELRVDERQSAH